VKKGKRRGAKVGEKGRIGGKRGQAGRGTGGSVKKAPCAKTGAEVEKAGAEATPAALVRRAIG